MNERDRHCYPVTLPTNAEARRILGMKPHPASDTTERLTGFLCGAFGPPCYHCGGVADRLCDFPLRTEGRTCDRSLCLECGPNVGFDGSVIPLAQQTAEADYKNYCHDHDEHGRGMLLFPTPKPAQRPPGPPPIKRAKPLPKAPPADQRWRVRQGRGDPSSHGAALTSWQSELVARQFAKKVGGYVETWDEFVKLWRSLYPLAPRKK